MLPPEATDRVLVGRPATIRFTVLDQDGSINPDASAITYGVATVGGTEVIAPGAEAALDAGVASAQLTAAQLGELNTLVITWRGSDDVVVGSSIVAVVGGYIASVADVRASDPTLTSEERYPTELIVAGRNEADRYLESVTGRAFTPRHGIIEIAPAVHGRRLYLPIVDLRRVRAVTEHPLGAPAGTTWDPAQVAGIVCDSSGFAYLDNGARWPTCRLVVEYEYGLDSPPLDLSRAFLRWLRHELNSAKSGIPDRATSFVDHGGATYRVITPGVNGAITAIPDVDVVINRYTADSAGIV